MEVVNGPVAWNELRTEPDLAFDLLRAQPA
jgi:hypothetical protein